MNSSSQFWNRFRLLEDLDRPPVKNDHTMQATTPDVEEGGTRLHLRVERFVWLGLVPLLAIIAIGFEDSVGAEPTFHVAGVAATLSLAALLSAVYRTTRNALTPLALASVHLFALYPLHGWVTFDDIQILARLGSDGEIWRAEALLWVAASVPFFWWGVQARWPSRIVNRIWSPRWEVDEASRSILWKIVVVALVGWSARTVLAAQGLHLHQLRGDDAGADIGGFGFLTTAIGSFPALAMVYALVVGVVRRSGLTLVAGLTFVVAEIGWGLLSGSRAMVIVPLAATAIALSLSWRRFRLLPTVGIGVVFIAVLFPLLTNFRTNYSSRRIEVARDGTGAEMVLDTLGTTLEEEEEEEEGSTPLEILGARLHGLTSFALVIRYTPERHPFMFGESLILLPLAILVPRFVWPGKPDPSPFRSVFKHEYWGERRESKTTVAPSQLGFFWVNFHFVGVLGGMFLTGAFFTTVLYRVRFGFREWTLYRCAVVGLLTMSFLHNLENNFDAFLSGTMKMLVVYLIVGRFLRSQSPRPQPNRVG